MEDSAIIPCYFKYQENINHVENTSYNSVPEKTAQ